MDVIPSLLLYVKSTRSINDLGDETSCLHDRKEKKEIEIMNMIVFFKIILHLKFVRTLMFDLCK